MGRVFRIDPVNPFGKAMSRHTAAFAIVQFLLLVASSCAGANPPGAGPETAIRKEGKSVIMQVQFIRSGGFAGAATNVSGTIEFTDKGAHVRSEAAAYQRDIPATEAE